MAVGLPVNAGATLRICPQCGTETTFPACKRDGFATVERARFVPRAAIDRTGEVLAGRWRIDGAMRAEPLGVLYRAHDLSLARTVGLRLIDPVLGTSLDRIARFQREGRFLASLAHPNIVQTYEHGVAQDGTLYVIEELAAGECLSDVIARGPMEIGDVVALGKELFDALAEAHAHGVQHRSLSLRDVRWLGGGRAKVQGFGWVKILSDEQAAFTFPKELGYAFATMAPEQARGKGVSGHADLYSAGAVLYAALTGVLPFGDGSPSDLLVAHAVKMPKVPERDGVTLSGPLVELVMRCLEKKPWNRPDGVQAALEQLERCGHRPFQHTSSAAFADTPAPIPQSPASRRDVERTGILAARPAGIFAETGTGEGQAADDGSSLGTLEARAERPALPMATLPGTAPRIVKSVSLTAGRAEPTSPVEAMRDEDSRPERFKRRSRGWGWAAMVALGVIGGVAGGLVASRTGTTTAPSEGHALQSLPAMPAVSDRVVPPPAVIAEPLPVAVSNPAAAPPTTPAPWPSVVSTPEPVRPDVTRPASPSAPITIASTEKQPPKPAAAAPEKNAAARKEAPRAEKKPAPGANAKDPFADLEDPSIAPSAKPPAVTRRVLVDSDPAGATVAIEGRVAGQTPLYVEWDDVGAAVSIRLSKPGYGPLTTSLGPKTGRAVFLVMKASDSP